MTEQEWLNNNQLSLDIWNKKYRYNNETFEEWLDRVSGNNQEIKRLIREKKFLFGGRILASRGITDRKVTYSNCYVLSSPEDSIESIFETGSKLARIYSYGGGVGIDISNLRPRGAKVNNAAKTTTGSTSFMDFFSYITGLIGQEGRRGALMLSIDCKHPDLVDFINVKKDLNVCTKANISVRVSDDFMKAVKEDKNWELSYTSEHETITKTVKAKDILMLLAKNNWEMAEPGILFWDNIQNYNMLNNTDFKYAGTNPCAEEPLPAGGSCLLGSINLSEFVVNPFTYNSYLDTESLEKAVKISVKALNEVLIEGLSLHPLEEQRNSVRDWRQIGLGTMGLADMLIKLGITYGSNESLIYIGGLFKLIATTAVKTSLQLAKDKECYPKCEKSKLIRSNFIKKLDLPEEILDEIEIYGLYNSQLLTCAPTGSIATMLETSTGVEPLFALEYTRKTQSLNGQDTYYKVNTKIVQDYLDINNNKDLPNYFITSSQINPIDRIKVQGIMQEFIDASISSTINLPKETSIKDIYNIYIKAWEYGLKGCTVYRSGCNRDAILSTDNKEENKQEFSTKELKRGEIIKSDNNCIGLKRDLMTGCGSLHCQAFFDSNNGELRECYLSKGSLGGCQNFMIGLSRMISLSARGGLSINSIIDQLKSCGVCPSYAVRTATKKDTSKGSCCPVAVGNALLDMYKEVQETLKSKTEKQTNIEIVKEMPKEELEECPNCHEKSLTRQGGCFQCLSCGYSKCE